MPIGRGGLAYTVRLLTATLKPLKLSLPSFVTSRFYLSARLWTNFSKISPPRRSFPNERSRKEETLDLFFLLERAEICRGYNFEARKPSLVIRNWTRFLGRNIGTRWIVPAWKDKLYDVISRKNRATNFVKFYILKVCLRRNTQSHIFKHI